MRITNSFNRFVLTAMLAGSFAIAGQAQAKSDFDALLADVNFGGEVAATTQSVASDFNDLASTPATEALAIPAISEPLPAPSIPAPIAYEQTSIAASGGQVVTQCCNQCGTNCGKKCRLTGLNCRDRIQPGGCQTYAPPQLPTSTFYQYWRSNACNVNVWDGYGNQCRTRIDLSINGRQNCGCSSGACDANRAVDCGPMPVQWSGNSACDACDSQ